MRELKSLFILLIITALVQISYGQDQSKGTEEIICPCMVEYEFPGNESDFFYQLTGGVPVLRFEEAKIKDDNTLVCVYEREFASGNLTTEHEGFTFWGDDCANAPQFLTMTPKNLERFAPGWQMVNDVKIRKTYSGYVLYNIECAEDGNDAYCWHGVTYKKRIMDDSDPNLYADFEVFAKVNDEKTGFILSETIMGLSDSEGEMIQSPAPPPNLNKFHKVKKPIKILRPSKKKIK